MNIEPNPRGVAPQSLGREPVAVKAPLVSVIVTNHNYGRFLSSCLASICAQSYVNIECIVVDDASTDDSVYVLDAFVDEGRFAGAGRSLQVIKLPVNAGMAGAASEGFKRSTGHYIIFFDADDMMLPHLIEAHITAFFYSRIGVGISSTDMFYEQAGEIIRAGFSGFAHFINAQTAGSQVIFRQTPLPFSCHREACEPAFDLSPAELYHLPPEHPGWAWAATSALCFRREMVEQMFRRVPKLSGVLDAYLLRGIHPFTGAILIDRPLVIYRIHQNNDWIKFAPIENFSYWDAKRELGTTRRIADEILQTHLLNADFYAGFLYNQDSYIQAIEWLYLGSDKWSTKGPPAEAFSTQAFLISNEARLRTAFGDATYQRWMGPYTRGGRVARFLWRSELFAPMRKILQKTLSDAGMTRLRALLYR